MAIRVVGRADEFRAPHRVSVTAPLTLIVGIAASSAVLTAVAIADTIRTSDQAPCEGARATSYL